jgi:formiminotetrahydrofolate cyclodeaminase
MSRLTDRPVRELLAAFANAAPTPGGGSAAALTASVGLSLLAMVASMSRTRNGSDADRSTLDAARTAVEHLGEHTLAMVDDDAAAYDAVVAAYRLPRTTEDEKAERRRAIEAALRGAAEVPLEVMRACRAGLTAAVDVARAGNPSASSDVGVSVELLKAALHCAALNIGVNLGSLSDAGYVTAVTAETASLENSAAALAASARGALS